MPVLLDVEAALELGGAQPVGRVLLVYGYQMLVVETDVEPGGVRGDDPLPAAEEPPQRLTGQGGLDVPQGRVQRTDGAEHRSGVAGLEGVPQHPVVERGDGARILPLDRGEERSRPQRATPCRPR